MIGVFALIGVATVIWPSIKVRWVAVAELACELSNSAKNSGVRRLPGILLKEIVII